MSSEGTYHNLETLRLTTEGDKEFEAILVQAFCEEAPGMIEGMQTAYNEGNLEEMGRFAHSLKPNAQMFGIDSIRESILAVETLGKENRNTPELKGYVDEIVRVLTQVVKELE
ncbi:MAG: Hpt domain-containing protein [Flavobacteriia bacterium]|nr:Hpt domain-containing protein [Flavobacteriia bacterium]